MWVSAKPTGIVFIGLSLLMVSFAGLAQQGSDESDGIEDDFDLNEVFERIVHTRSLGGLTKLSLKKDYDRLLDKIRNYHEGGKDISLEQLHERYDVMLHRLKILLQDKDEELVSIIHDARDEFWAILSDEEKFAKMMGTSP
jgi:hypothetical protein